LNPVVLSCAGVPFFSLHVLQAFIFGICVQAGANLTNTYYDFINGNDTKDDSGDRALVDE
jgi:1,4-dihydroxy-2-naphthoate octaprenyltransferase